jgi:Brp/Blh family beta-carotene 15,15'-monooxygenase
MLRLGLIILGFLLLLLKHFFFSDISMEYQVYGFLGGILILGVPHGAADMMVAASSAERMNTRFSMFVFLSIYLFRLLLFAALLWFFPLVGNLLFIVFAAYHFGETDLHQFKTETVIGKLFVISYGLLILGFILLQHFDELMPLFSLFPSGRSAEGLIHFIHYYRKVILMILLALFIIVAFIYFSAHEEGTYNPGLFIVHLGLVLLILYALPMMLAFTFYFIVWHSLLSLKNIIGFLRINTAYSYRQIIVRMLVLSVLAMGGIALFGAGGFMFLNHQTMLVYVFLGLAVLTAPHLQVMHEMYRLMRR